MKRQMVKGLTMSILIVTVAFATAVVTANGQSQRTVTHIPFDFVVGGRTLPAGEYETNSAINNGAAVMVRSTETKTAAIRLTNSIQANPEKTQARLIFHRYGQNYFLAEVWVGGDNQGRALLESKQERQLRRELAAVAQNSYETIELVASLR
jgi:hypothetical protein